MIDSSNVLHLFIGGSLDAYDSQVDIAIQSNGTGVSTLAGQAVSNAQGQVTFDTGFKPNALITLAPTYNGPAGAQDSQTGIVRYLNLATGSDPVTASTVGVTTALNNALVNTLVGSGAAGDPGFAGATTGLELAIPLTGLGAFTTGTSVEVSAFVFENSVGAVDNQVLSPFSYFAHGGGNALTASGTPVDTSARVDPINNDYTFTGTTNGSSSPAGRQFNSAAYPGLQYFTVGVPAASVPEPATLGLLVLGAVPLLRRRSQGH